MSGRTALLVLGMHRSGTSAMARLLVQAGAALPRDVLGAGPHNPAGHWEPAAVMAFNDALLHRHGSIWHAPFAPRVDAAPLVPQARAILREQWGEAPLILLKEPRVTLLAELWLRALAEEGFRSAPVVMVRDPREVAASLAAAHGLDPVHAMLSWASHTLAAERATANATRVVVGYDRLLADPSGVLAAVGDRFGMPLSPAAAAVEPALRHHSADALPWPPGLERVAALHRHCRALAEGAAGDPGAVAGATAWLELLEPVVAPLLAERDRDCGVALADTDARWAARLAAAECERDRLLAASLG